MTKTNAERALEMRYWQCHKRVRAAKIVDIKSADEVEPVERGEIPGLAVFVEGVEGYFNVHHSWAAKQGPVLQPGNMLVFYEDGYMSVSPVDTFESGYAEIVPGSGEHFALMDLAIAHLYFIGPLEWQSLAKTMQERYTAFFEPEAGSEAKEG
jgi:hypothetical protein